MPRLSPNFEPLSLAEEKMKSGNEHGQKLWTYIPHKLAPEQSQPLLPDRNLISSSAKVFKLSQTPLQFGSWDSSTFNGMVDSTV